MGQRTISSAGRGTRRLAVALAALTGLAAVTATAVTTGPATGATTTAQAMPGGRLWIGGHPYRGGTWVAVTSGWPAGTAYSYDWLLDGRTVSHGASYVVPTADLNDKVQLQVTGHAAGYAGTQTVTTPALRVQPANPLAGGMWGVDTPAVKGGDPVAGYAGRLPRIADEPRMQWLVSSSTPKSIHNYIAAEQHGDPNALVQFAIFREFAATGETGAKTTTLTAAQQASYKRWIDQTSAAIGTTRSAIVLEPDLAEDAPPNGGGAFNKVAAAVRLRLVRYAAQHLHAHNPRTTVYLDAGDADWQSISQEVTALRAAGIQYARGFALGATHYGPITGRITGENGIAFDGELGYGAQLSQALARAGLSGKHFVIDTADNGRGFSWGQYEDAHGSRACSNSVSKNVPCFDNAATCRTKTQSVCDTLGVDPTWQVVDAPGVRLTAAEHSEALSFLDAYLWFGRPWMLNQAWPLAMGRAEAVQRSTPIATPASVCWRAAVPLANAC